MIQNINSFSPNKLHFNLDECLDDEVSTSRGLLEYFGAIMPWECEAVLFYSHMFNSSSLNVVFIYFKIMFSHYFYPLKNIGIQLHNFVDFK